jgi:rubrerythrin
MSKHKVRFELAKARNEITLDVSRFMRQNREAYEGEMDDISLARYFHSSREATCVSCGQPFVNIHGGECPVCGAES